MKKNILLLLTLATSCLMTASLKAASTRREFLREPQNKIMSTEQARRLEEQERREEEEAPSDDQSETSTQVDSLHDGNDALYQGESSSIALLQPKRQGTAPGDDQSLLDLEELISCLVLKQEALEQSRATQEGTPLEQEMEAVKRGIDYFKSVCDLEETDATLAFYQRCAGVACLQWQRAKHREKPLLVIQSYQSAFDYFEQAITSKKEQIRCQRQDPLDDLATESLHSLGMTYFRKAELQESQKTDLIIKMCEAAKNAFESVQVEVVRAQEWRNNQQDEDPKRLQQMLGLITKMTETCIDYAREQQKLGYQFLARIPYKEGI